MRALPSGRQAGFSIQIGKSIIGAKRTLKRDPNRMGRKIIYAVLVIVVLLIIWQFLASF
jgi:hypothetical protein